MGSGLRPFDEVGGATDCVSRGLKPEFCGGVDVRAEAWIYLRNKGNSGFRIERVVRGQQERETDKDEMRGSADSRLKCNISETGDSCLCLSYIVTWTARSAC